MESKDIIKEQPEVKKGHFFKPEMPCKRCGGIEYIKAGTKPVAGGSRQQWRCVNPSCHKIEGGELLPLPETLKSK